MIPAATQAPVEGGWLANAKFVSHRNQRIPVPVALEAGPTSRR
jgi:hypothetical protein